MKANRKANVLPVSKRKFSCECGGKFTVTLSHGEEGIDATIDRCGKCNKQNQIKDL